MHLTNTLPKLGSNLMHISQSCKRKGKHLSLQCENKAPQTHTRIFLKKEIFSLRFSLPFTRTRRFRAPNAQVFENGSQSGVFFENLAGWSFSCGRKWRFSNAMMSYIIQRMPCKGCYRISFTGEKCLRMLCKNGT